MSSRSFSSEKIFLLENQKRVRGSEISEVNDSALYLFFARVKGAVNFLSSFKKLLRDWQHGPFWNSGVDQNVEEFVCCWSQATQVSSTFGKKN